MRKFIRYLPFLLSLVFSHPVLSSGTEDPNTEESGGNPKVATTMPASNVEAFALWEESNFSTFFYDTTADFSRYDQAIFFPMTFDRMELADESGEKFSESWQKSSFNEMDKICQFFDDYLLKKFKSSKYIQPTLKGGPNVLAIEFRMKNFMPTSLRREDALGTVGESGNMMGVGTLTFQAVLVESQTGKLVAVIEDGLQIASGSYSIDNRVGRNLAWKRSFQKVVQKLHDDFKTLHKSPP